jgi:AraC family ethanolamine operon transcriptional activator
VRDVLASAGSGSHFEATLAARLAAARAQKLASAIMSERSVYMPNQGGRPDVSRQEIIRHCKHLLEERNGRRVLVNELACWAGVSERTLRTAFNEYFGVGPVRYLLLRQLHQVNRALQTSDPCEELVTDVLFRHGVWELSRFARRYRQTFGELPSQTLRTTKPLRSHARVSGDLGSDKTLNDRW